MKMTEAIKMNRKLEFLSTDRRRHVNIFLELIRTIDQRADVGGAVD